VKIVDASVDFGPFSGAPPFRDSIRFRVFLGYKKEIRAFTALENVIDNRDLFFLAILSYSLSISYGFLCNRSLFFCTERPSYVIHCIHDESLIVRHTRQLIASTIRAQ